MNPVGQFNGIDSFEYFSNINIQLKLNYLYVAKAAEYCYAHFTAILYADLWVTCQETVDKAKSDPMMLSIMKEVLESFEAVSIRFKNKLTQF